MDTAQRGMGLNWESSLELIGRSIEAGKARPGAVLFSGAGTDHLAPAPEVTVDDVIRAYEKQIEAIEALGGRIILMASRALAACARSPDDYAKVYDRILSQLAEPCIIHWLGEMFDPGACRLLGLMVITWRRWTSALDVIAEPTRTRSMASRFPCSTRTRRSRMRRPSLPDGVRMYSGDDFNYALN